MAEPTDLELWLSRSATPGPVDLDLGASLNDVLVRGTLTAQLQASLASVAADIVIPGSLAAQDNPSGRISGTVVIEGVMVGRAPQLVAIAHGDMVITGEVTAETREAAMLASGSYDINVYRDPAGYGGSRWLRTAASQAPESAQIIWDAGLRTNPVKISGWQAPAGIERQSVGQFSSLPSSDSARVERTAEAAELINGGWWPWVSLPSSHRARYELHAEALPVGSGSAFPFYPKLPRWHRQRQESWHVPAIVSMSLLRQRIVKGRWLEIENHSLFDSAICPGPGRHDLPDPPTPPLATPVNLDLRVLRWLMPDLDFYPRDSTTIIIPTREVYFVINSIEFYRASTGLEVALASVSVTLDTDSMAWQLTASVPRISDARMLNGEQVTLSINGYNWQFVIDSWSENRSYNQRGATITGRSLSAVLSSSLSLKRSYTEQSARTLIQLAERELPDGWSLDWLASDWLVDPSVWSYSNLSPIEAIQTLATAAGAFIYPSLNSRSLAIKPLFNALPWTLGNASPDIYIPDSIITTLGSQYQRRQAADGVWLTGGSAGISALVKRTGTAGSNQLPDVTNSLITTPDAARALGSSLLAKSMPFSSDTLQMPISVDTGLVAPGLVVETTSGIGYSRGLKVSASTNTSRAISVTQTVEIDRYEVA